MRCTRPQKVGFLADGKTLTWSPLQYSKQYAPFQLPCGKCPSCRLLQAREKAIRCVHEASCHTNNSFITLTYSDEHLESEKLIYAHAQKFLRDLRDRNPHLQIPTVITGEYGIRQKRPHFHILLFNYAPHDQKPYKHNKQGDLLYTSSELDDIWNKNSKTECPTLVGPVNLQTAGYVCRYQLKKLDHKDSQPGVYDPIVRYSSKYAIGKNWIQNNWKQTFELGYITVQGGEKLKIPRYYEKWLKENQPDAFKHYVTNIRVDVIKKYGAIQEKEELEYLKRQFKRSAQKGLRATLEITDNKMREIILDQKTKLITQEL